MFFVVVVGKGFFFSFEALAGEISSPNLTSGKIMKKEILNVFVSEL